MVGETRFFSFVNTVTARNFQGTTNAMAGWGVRFQIEPRGAPSEVILHVRMLDTANILRQQALGIFGVNMIHGAYHFHSDPEQGPEGRPPFPPPPGAYRHRVYS